MSGDLPSLTHANRHAPTGDDPVVPPWEFWVDAYGAAGDGTTDDTTAINDAVGAATAYAKANNGYAAIRFAPTTYRVDGALRTDRQGNAQIPLPVVQASEAPVTLAFLGSAPFAAPNPYFHQDDTLPVTGTTIVSGLTGQSYSSTYGSPSIIGGPQPEQGWGFGGSFESNVFDNLFVICDGITLAPQFENGAVSVGGMHLGCIAKAHVQSLSVIASGTFTQMRAAAPSNSWVSGLYMPQDGNNDNCVVGSLSCYGVYTALFATEHTTVTRMMAIYCHEAVRVHAVAWHGVSILNASIEACVTGIVAQNGSAGPLRPINVHMADFEDMSHYTGTGYHIDDPNNSLGGIINIVEPGGGGSNGGTIRQNGGDNITVNNLLTRSV